jgi:hypothetical protein
MEEYAELTVVFLAPADQLVTLADEGKLSDEYTKIADELNAWLKQRIKGTPFTIRVEVE